MPYIYEDRFQGSPFVTDYTKSSTKSVLEEQFAQSFEENPIMAALRWDQLVVERSRGPKLTKPQAEEVLQLNGLQGFLPVDDNGISSEALKTLMARKRVELRRDAIFSRASGGVVEWTGRLGVALATTGADPVSVGTAFIPVVGQARYLKALSSAKTFLGRTGVRLATGAIEGAAGAAMVEPLIYGSRRAEQADYDAVDSLMNASFGAIFGASLHATVGSIADVASRFRRRVAVSETPPPVPVEEPPPPPPGFDADKLVDTLLEVPGERAKVDAIYQENRRKIMEDANNSNVSVLDPSEHVERTRKAVGQAVLEEPIDVTPPGAISRRTFLQGAAAVTATVLMPSAPRIVAPLTKIATSAASVPGLTLRGTYARLAIEAKAMVFRAVYGSESIEQIRLLDSPLEIQIRSLSDEDAIRIASKGYEDGLSEEELTEFWKEDVNQVQKGLRGSVEDYDAPHLSEEERVREYFAELSEDIGDQNLALLDEVSRSVGQEPNVASTMQKVHINWARQHLESLSKRALQTEVGRLRKELYEALDTVGGEEAESLKKLIQSQVRAVGKKSTTPDQFLDFYSKLEHTFNNLGEDTTDSDVLNFRDLFMKIEGTSTVTNPTERVPLDELPPQLTHQPWIEGIKQPDPEPQLAIEQAEQTIKDVPENPAEAIDEDLAVAESNLKETEQRLQPEEKTPDPEVVEVEEASQIAERWAKASEIAVTCLTKV